jgi:hypothetical protein
MNHLQNCCRTTFLLSLLFIAESSFGIMQANAYEPAPGEFAGLKWRATKAEVKAVMASKGAKPENKWETASKLVFQYGKLAGMGVDAWDIDLSDGKFWRGVATFTQSAPSDTIYGVLKKMLTEKYGPPKREWTKPLLTIWSLNNPETHEGVTITLHLRAFNDPRIQVDYQNDEMKKHVRPEEDAGTPNPSGL